MKILEKMSRNPQANKAFQIDNIIIMGIFCNLDQNYTCILRTDLHAPNPYLDIKLHFSLTLPNTLKSRVLVTPFTSPPSFPLVTFLDTQSSQFFIGLQLIIKNNDNNYMFLIVMVLWMSATG